MNSPDLPGRTQFFSGGTLDRAAVLRRDADALAVRLDHPDTRLVPVWQSHSLVNLAPHGAAAVTLPRPIADPWLGQAELPVFLGVADDIAYFAIDLSAVGEADLSDLADFGQWRDLRLIGALLPQADGALLAYARGMVHWHRSHRFCGRCGSATDSADGGHVRRCPACATLHYPRSDPAVIMLVHSGDHCLLGRQSIWPAGMMSTLAGFVEPGESLEEAVAREVLEESGVRVAKVRYRASQPWPFPTSLMLGFTALCDGRADIVIDPTELETAAWFSRAEIRAFAERGLTLPGEVSIARRLIEDWLADG